MFICTAQVHNTKCPQMDPNTYANMMRRSDVPSSAPAQQQAKSFSV